jgi:hypothetical protein
MKAKIVVWEGERHKLYFCEILKEDDWSFTVRTLSDNIVFRLAKSTVLSVKMLDEECDR